jgi:hypothetical protein
VARARILTHAVLPVALVLALAAALFLFVRHDDRDEAAFQSYVAESTPGRFATTSGADPHRWEHEWAAAHPTTVLAEGDAACRWLSGRADPPGADPSGAFSVGTLVSTYLRETDQPGVKGFSALGKGGIVAGAWAHLCPSTRAGKTHQTEDEED